MLVFFRISVYMPIMLYYFYCFYVIVFLGIFLGLFPPHQGTLSTSTAEQTRRGFEIITTLVLELLIVVYMIGIPSTSPGVHFFFYNKLVS